MNVLNISFIVIALASIVTGRGIFSPSEIEDEHQLIELFDRDLENNVEDLLEDSVKVLNFKLKLSDLLELKLSTSVKPSYPTPPKPTEATPKPPHPTPPRPTETSSKPPHPTPPKPTEASSKPPHPTPPKPTEASSKPPRPTTSIPTDEPPKSTTRPTSLSPTPAELDPSKESSQSSVLIESSSEPLLILSDD